MSKMRCMRAISKTARTGLESPHSFRSPSAALSRRRHDRMAPKPALSTNCSSLISSSTLRFVSSIGPMSRLNSSTTLASRCSARGVTTATSPIFSTLISIVSLLMAFGRMNSRQQRHPVGVRRLFAPLPRSVGEGWGVRASSTRNRFAVFDKTDRVLSLRVAGITDLVHALADHIDAKAALARAIECGRTDLSRIELFSRMENTNADLVGKRLGLDTDRLIGATAIGVAHDVAGGLIDGKLKLALAILVERRGREIAAELAHERPNRGQLREIAGDLQLGMGEGRSRLDSAYLDGHAGQIV